MFHYIWISAQNWTGHKGLEICVPMYDVYVVLNIIFCCNHQFDRTMVRNFKTDYLNDVVIFLQFFGSGKINDFKILDFLEN